MKSRQVVVGCLLFGIGGCGTDEASACWEFAPATAATIARGVYGVLLEGGSDMVIDGELAGPSCGSGVVGAFDLAVRADPTRAPTARAAAGARGFFELELPLGEHAICRMHDGRPGRCTTVTLTAAAPLAGSLGCCSVPSGDWWGGAGQSWSPGQD